jgi:hypothetical protein
LSESEFVQVVFIVCLYLYYIRGPIIKTIDFAGKTWNIFYRNVNQVPCDQVYQLLAHGQWFSPGTLASSTTKTGRHDIAERISDRLI